MPKAPPSAASSALGRQDQRPRVLLPGPSVLTSPALSHGGNVSMNEEPKPSRLADYPVTYWADVMVGLSGSGEQPRFNGD